MDVVTDDAISLRFAGVSAYATAKHETQGGSKPLSSLNTVNEPFLINIS